jgi:hypothetical protein
MNKRQRTIIREFLVIIAITTAAVLAMMNFKDWTNRSEAIRAMGQLSQRVQQYRKEHGMVPPQSFVDRVEETLEGQARLGRLEYRGIWINFESSDDEILAYSERRFHSLLVGSGYVVLRLDGRVEWLEKAQFEAILAKQQSQYEVEVLQERHEPRTSPMPEM